MSKCADIRGELGKVYLLYLKSKVNRDTIEVVSKNVKDLTQGLVNKYQDGLTPQILNEFYNSVEEIFKKYNNSNKINSDFLKGIQVPVEVKTEIEQVIDQGTYMDFRFKNSNNSDSDASKDVDLKKVNSEEDLLDIFNGSNEMYGAFIRRFNTDILNMVLFGYNSEGKSSFNNSIEQLNKNISQWSHEITDEFNEKFDKDFSKIDSNIASSKLIDVTDDGKDSLYRKFVSRHFDKLINLTDNKIIRKNNKSNIYEPKISSSIRTGWTNNEFISAFDELGDFIKEVVESRKIIDINGNETGQTLSWSQIFMSLGKLQGYVDRTENYYLDNLISDIVNSKKNGKNTGKIVRESKIFNDITIDELNTLNSLYVHFFNKDPNGFTSKNGNLYSSFYNRSLNSYKDSDSRNSNIIDYYDLVKYNFEKQSTNKYSQVVYDYDKKTFVQEDLNTIRTNKQRSLYVNGLNMYKDLFDYDALPDKIKEISDKFELIKTNNNGINGYSLKYKHVEILNTNALNSFDLSILSTEDDYNNMSKLIDYIITVNPTIVPTDFIKYILQTTSTKKENDFDKINNAYRKVLLPITNRMLSIIGNDKMNFFSESDTQDSSGYKYALTEYAKWLDVISGDNIKAVTKTANDTFVPSFGQINMVKEPRTLISFLKKTLRKSKQKNSPVSANVFMKGQNDKALKEPVTDTFIYFKGEAIPIAKAGSTELFINHFMIKYLFNIANNDYNIQVQPATYSDKSKQTSAVIDSKSVIDYSSQNQQSIADKDVTEMKSMLLDNMEESYSAIINHVIGTLNMSLGTKKTSLNSIQDYIIEKKLKVSDIIKLADSKGLYIFSTMFFEGEKINSLLMQIDKQPSILKKMVEDDLKNSIEMLNSENIFIDYKMFKPTIDLVLNGQYGEKFKTTDSSFEENWVDQSTGRIIMEKDGKINPLYERYFYEKNIYSENYRTLLAGNLAMHPAKGGAKSFTENVSKRYVAQTKRTVGMQGTIHPYRLGMYNGLPYYEKIAFVQDPKMALFNQMGNNHNQEVTDGSSFSLFLSTILKNNSLLDQGGQIHHKSLGMMIEPNSGSFMLMKHADHSMTNERLRNSKYAEFNLNNIVRKMMNQPLGYNIDLTKDFNGKPIYKSRSASYRYDGSLYTILDIIKDEKSGPNNYKFIVEETDGNTTNREEYSVPINSLYDLWSMLGGENSITMDYSTGKYKYDNSSWYNLADFINKVGFYKNEKNLKSFMDKNEIKDYKKFRQDITSNRYDDDSSVEYLEERPSADSVYQPLKDKFISQITFTTSQKVGAVNPNSVSVLSDDTPFMTFDHYSSIYTGLQLDHEHHTDDSDITEPTQILSAILFDGDASQYNRQLKMGIKLSIIHNISKYLKTNPNLKSIDMDKLRQTISSNFLNELKKKDLSNFASSVCMNIQNSINKILNEANIKLNNGDVDGYNRLNNEANSISTQVPFSDPGLYNAFINIMNSTFTSLAIRRKLEGSMNILSPQNYFITVHEKDGKVMIGEEFDGEISYTPIDKTNVRMFDKIRVTSADGLSDEFDLKDYNSFQQFRNFTGDFVVEKINGAGRRLLPHRVMFSFDGQNQIDYYSLDSSNLINYFKYIKSLDKGSDLYKLKTQEYLYIVKKAVSDFDLKHPLINSIIEKIKSGLTKDSELSNQEFNILKNLQSMYYKKLKEDGMANNPVYNIISNINSIPEDIKNLYLNQNYEQFFNELLKLDVSTPIQNYTEEPAEVMMPANLGKSFMIEEGDNINEIDENVLYNRLIQKYNTFSIENIGVRSESTVLEYSGNNLYVLLEQDINKIKTDPKLSKFITPSYKYNGENDNKYIIDQKTGEQILNIKSLQFYEHRKGKNTYRLVSYRNPNDIKLLNGFDDGKGNAYSIVLDNENYDDELQVYSKRLYNNFKASLIGAMCRIPSQAKQSGMPFKVVGFIKTENNVAFVPAENLWLTGGDYDIDKIVQALLSFHKNGMIKKFNPYFLENDSEFIIESLNLPVPDMVLRTISQSNTNKSSYNITANDLELLNKLQISSKKEDTSSITLDEFKRITHVLNDIVNADNNVISISPTEQVNTESLKNVNELLQDMFIRGYSLLEDPSVLENVIVGAMIHAYNDGRNALHTYAPMDSDTIKDIAKESSKGAIMAKFSPTNPVTDVLMQITNMVGKDGIAIAATGQKALSIIIDRYLKIKSGDFKNIAFESNLASLVSEITGEGEEETTRIINGFDLKGIGQNLVEFFRQNFSDDLFKTEDPSGQLSNKEYWIKNKIESLFDESNNSLNVSELITLATDNAKELVLDKINASVDTLGMYIYAIAIGIDVKKFTRFMTLPVIDKLIKLSKSNVINPERSEASIVGSIKEIQNKFLNTENYSKYMSIRHAPSILEAISPGFKKSAKLTDYEAYKLFKGLIQGLDSSDIDDKSKLEKFDLEIRRIRDAIESGKIKKIRVQKYIAKKVGDDYDDLSSEDEFGGDGSVDIAESFNKWYQDSRKMVGSISKEDIEAINLFERIKDESGALKVLGQVLGINQKIKTEEYDFYKYNSTLSNFLNNLTNKYFLNLQKINPKSSPESIVELLKSQLPALYNDENGFDFTLFLSDENYREKTIQEYSVLTKNSQINILEILASSEHFMGMISLTYSLSENVFKPSSSKYRTLNRIIKKIESEKTFGNNGILPKSISKDIYAKLSNYVDDLIIQQFLSQNNGMKVMINQGDPYSYIHDNEIIKSKSRGKNESIDLSTYEGRNKFTSWFENIIRNIQLNKQFRDDKGNLYKNESFSNAFINNIIPEYKRDMLTEEDYGIIKPSISISVNMTMQDAALKQKMVEGLKELKNVKYNGHNMLDLLFIYDLIVNRAKKNQSSFAGFIAEAYPMDNIKLISNQYISYLKEIDGNNISFDYNKNDFLIRGIAEKQSSKPAPGAIYYNQYYDSSTNKIKRDYIQDGVIFNLNLNSMHKNMPLNTSVVKTKIIDPGIIISINNSDIKITIKC